MYFVILFHRHVLENGSILQFSNEKPIEILQNTTWLTATETNDEKTDDKDDQTDDRPDDQSETQVHSQTLSSVSNNIHYSSSVSKHAGLYII